MLVFIDESGHPRPTDDTTRPVLLAVCIKETDIRYINKTIHKIKLEVYKKADVEIKATNLIKRKTLDKKFTNNKLFVDKIMDEVSKLNINVFAIIMERPDENIIIKDGILQNQYKHMLKKIDLHCRFHKHLMALVIFDEQDRNNDKILSIAFNNFLYQSALGKNLEKILEAPLFVNSDITPGIQLADLFAGIVRNYYESELHIKKPADEYQEWLYDLFNIIKRKTEDLTDDSTGYKEFGFFTMSKSTLLKSLEDQN